MNGDLFAAIPVFVRMRSQAMRNALSGLSSSATGPRGGTARKGQFAPSRLILLLAFFSTGMSYVLLAIMAMNFGEPVIGRRTKDAVLLAAGVQTEGFMLATSFLALAWAGTCILFALGHQNRDLARLGDDVELLMSLPLSLTSIYLAKVAERVVLNPAWVILVPFYAAVMWHAGHRVVAIPAALAITLLINLVMAITLLAIELMLRRTLETFALTRIQAIATAGASLMLTLTMLAPMLFGLLADKVGPIGFAAGRFALYLPTSILMPLLIGGSGWWRVGAFLAEIALLLVLGTLAIEKLTSGGLEAIHGAARSSRSARRSRSFATGILAKDLKMLRRDPRLLGTALAPLIGLIPMLIIPGVFDMVQENARAWNAIAFGVGMMLVLGTATSAVLHERDALWILFSLPVRLERLMFQKAMLWGGLGVALSLSIIVAGVVVRGATKHDLDGIVWVVAGLSMFSILAVSLGMLGTDPATAGQSIRIREDLVLGALVLGAILTGGAWVPSISIRLVLLLFFGILTWASWRKAAYRASALLDPTSWPPARVELADGMIGVLVLFALQGVFTLALVESTVPVSVAVPAGYVLAAAGAIGLVATTLRDEGLSIIRAAPILTSGLSELRSGVAVALSGAFVSVAAVTANIFFVAGRGAPAKGELSWSFYAALVLAPLASVVVKPFADELLFRGIIFRSLRESLTMWSAAAISALLSSLMMGSVMAPSFFVVGMASALAMEKSKALLPSIVIHAAAMAAMMGVPLLLA